MRPMTPRLLYAAEPAKGWLPWGALLPVLGFLFVAVPFVGAAVVLEHWHLLDSQGQPTSLAGLLALLVLPFPVIAMVVWAWVHQVERRPLATIGLVGTGGAGLFVRGHAIGMACVIGIVLCIWAAGGYKAGGALAAFSSAGTVAGIVLLLFGFALQSSVEEFVFRGWMLSAIARKLNVPIAVVLSSIVFTALHFSPGQHPLAMVGTMAFALFACGWALCAGNLWGVMGWHAGWNWLLATGFQLPLSGVPSITPALLVQLVPQGADAITGGRHGPEASVASIVVFGTAAAVLLRRSRDTLQRLSITARDQQ